MILVSVESTFILHTGHFFVVFTMSCNIFEINSEYPYNKIRHYIRLFITTILFFLQIFFQVLDFYQNIA